MDRRFGENDPAMSLEERMLERFTRERQRGSTAAMFNLEDEQELTHYGQSLSKFDDFDDVGVLDDEDDEDKGMVNEILSRPITYFVQAKSMQQQSRRSISEVSVTKTTMMMMMMRYGSFYL